MASLVLSPPAPPPRFSLSSSVSSSSYSPCCSTSSSASSDFHNFGPRIPHFHSLKWSSSSIKSKTKRWVSSKAALDEVSFIEEVIESTSDPIPSLKLKLLSAVSGLNRGLVATEDDLRRADDAAKELEATGGPVDLSSDLDKLQGRWKLIYSSGFSSRTLGGSRPGPPIGRLLPITLGQVFQRIDVVSKDFDNIVELELGAPWPLPPIEVTATLAHKFELIGQAKVKIVFEKTTVKTKGNLSQFPPLDIPQLPEAIRPSTNRGSGDFEVTYVDSDTRITRGDRSELRVFVIA